MSEPNPDPLREALNAVVTKTTWRPDNTVLIHDGTAWNTLVGRIVMATNGDVQPAPALDVAGEALHTLLAPDLEIQARIEGVQAFVTYVAPGFAPGDAAYLMRAAERYSAIVRGDPA